MKKTLLLLLLFCYQIHSSAQNPSLVADINSLSVIPEVTVGLQALSNNILYFEAKDNNGGGLWRSDGTAEGTYLLKVFAEYGDFADDIEYLTDVNGTLFFTGWSQSENTGNELWKSDGTTEGTVLVKDIKPGENGSAPLFLSAVGSTLFFC